MLPFEFDFNNTDYNRVFELRLKRLEYIRNNPSILPGLRGYYKNNIADFIIDWGMTYDPRNVGTNKPVILPFILFKRQIEFCDYFQRKVNNLEHGLVEKSRDMGMSWLLVSIAVSLCLFNNDTVIGFGSRVEDLVDKNGDPSCLFWKAKFFLNNLPSEFRNGFTDKDAKHLQIKIPANKSVLIGEAGDNIGRGGRTSIYIIDEAAHIPRAHLIDASLSATTNVRFDLSSVNGMNNNFAIKRFSNRIEPFIFDWREDPRKNDAWYNLQLANLPREVIEQEIDRNYHAYSKGGKVYHYFNREKHHSNRVITNNDNQLHIAQDFNINACVSTIWIREGLNLIAVDEFVSRDTRDIINNIKSRYQNKQIIIYPDATGDNEHCSASESDIAILRNGTGFKINKSNKNPPIRDSVNSVNSLFIQNRISINTIKCAKLTHAIESQGYDDKGKPEKFTTHPAIDDYNDTMRYICHYLFPLTNRITVIS